MKLELIRGIDTGISVSGELYVDDKFIAYTLENTWLNNAPRTSCIPLGCYRMTTKRYGRFYTRYKLPIPILIDVPNRSEILIHPGNYPEDTQGCILVGSATGTDAVWASTNAWRSILPTLHLATEITIK